jgi:hypothetical protein
MEGMPGILDPVQPTIGGTSLPKCAKALRSFAFFEDWSTTTKPTDLATPMRGPPRPLAAIARPDTPEA